MARLSQAQRDALADVEKRLASLESQSKAVGFSELAAALDRAVAGAKMRIGEEDRARRGAGLPAIVGTMVERDSVFAAELVRIEARANV